MNQYNEFIRILKALDEKKVEYVLVGGFAVFLHGIRRFTQDLVLFLRLAPPNIDNLRDALKSVFDDPSIDEINFHELEEYPVIRYGTPGNFYIDILARLGEIFTYEDLEYEILEYEGVRIKVATPETLIRMKKDTIRPQDKKDALLLNEIIKRGKKL